MRYLLPAALLLLTACRQEPGNAVGNAAEPAASGFSGSLTVFAGEGRDRLCLSADGARAGLVTYGTGDANCSLAGAVQRSGERLTITPDGETSCTIAATLAGDRLTLGPASDACGYYCGPTASFAGRQFTRTDAKQAVTDLAGDPLC